MKDHGYITLQDVIRAMLLGTRFYHKDYKIYFDLEAQRFKSTEFVGNNEIGDSLSNFYGWASWKVKLTWKDKINTGVPILCHVEGGSRGKAIVYIESYIIEGSGDWYRCVDGNEWDSATPVTAKGIYSDG